MRLGDFDELKKRLHEYCIDNDTECQKYYDFLGIDECIDNAPTVEPCYQTTSCLDCKNYDKENYYCPRFCEVIREATKEIKRQGEWIPVSERLPEKNGFYITTCQDICERRVHTVCYDAKNKEWSRGGVIAWKPLPEPYMKGGAE